MKILDNDGVISPELQMMIAIVLEGTNAMEIASRRMNDALCAAGLERNTFHETKKALNDAKKYLGLFITQLNKCTEKYLVNAAMHSTKNGLDFAGNWDAIATHSNDILQLLILYYSRVEVNDSNRDRVKRAIRRLKGTEDYDTEEMVNIFKLK